MVLRRETTNVFAVASEAEWPETLDPFVIYNVLYDFPPFGSGLYSTDGSNLLPIADQLWVSQALGLSAIWKWSEDLTATDPGAGFIKANNAQIKNATVLYASYIDVTGADLGAGMKSIFGPGDEILITNVDRAGLTMFTLQDPAYVDQGTYLELNVAFFEGGKQNPPADDLIQLRWFDGTAPSPTKMSGGGGYASGIPNPRGQT